MTLHVAALKSNSAEPVTMPAKECQTEAQAWCKTDMIQPAKNSMVI